MSLRLWQLTVTTAFDERTTCRIAVSPETPVSGLIYLVAGSMHVPTDELELISAVEMSDVIIPPPTPLHTDLPQALWPATVKDMRRLVKRMVDRRYRARASGDELTELAMDHKLARARARLAEITRQQQINNGATNPSPVGQSTTR